MTRIDFYSTAGNKLLVACQLSAKAARQGMRVMVLAPEEDLLRCLDQLMWTWQPTGFLAHCVLPHKLSATTPVTLARTETHALHDEVLINLGTAPPEHFARYQRVAEPVGPGDSDRSAGRERFRFYRDRGYEIQHHQLAAQ